MIQYRHSLLKCYLLLNAYIIIKYAFTIKQSCSSQLLRQVPLLVVEVGVKIRSAAPFRAAGISLIDEERIFVERGQVDSFPGDPRPLRESFPVEIELGGVIFGSVQIGFVVEDPDLVESDLDQIYVPREGHFEVQFGDLTRVKKYRELRADGAVVIPEEELLDRGVSGCL